ncbi:MAG TPA: AraC family transcriptional regulator [Steroidobacteraceae bacterium]|jgi:AraC-like DNA-binding protein
MTHSEQWVRVNRFSGPYPGETVHAHYVQHRFARHAHDHLVIGLVEKGVQQYTYQGSLYRTYAGQIFFVDAGEPHTGEAATEFGYVYRTLCLDPRVLVGVAREVTDREELPHFCNAVIADRRLFAKLLGLHRAVGSGASTMHREALLLDVVAHLLRTHVERRRQSATVGRDEFVVRQLRDYLEAHYFEDVSLTQLGALVSRSTYHAARVFSKVCGLPPHAYLESIRIQRARELLASGASVADTALAVGYPDQSHFTHRFRRHTGITPGRYRDAAR